MVPSCSTHPSILFVLQVPTFLVTMSHRKTPARKRAGTSRNEPPPPLSQLPLRKWFSTNEIWKSYLDVFSKLHVLKPRYLSEGLLSEDKYKVFWKLVDQQGLRPLLFMKERYYPRMMAVVATTLRLTDTLDNVGNEEFYLRFWIASVTYTVTLEELASLWGLQNNGLRFKGGSSRPREYDHWDGESSQEPLQVSKIGRGKYSVGRMDTDHRLLHYMLSYIWLPRKRNHGVLIEEDLFILKVMVEEVELNWPYLLAHRLMQYTNNSLRISTPLGVQPWAWHALDQDGQRCSGGQKGRKNKAVTEDIPSYSGTGPDTQIPPGFMEAFAEGMHAFNTGWEEKTERADKRLSVVEGRVSSQAGEIQLLREDMRLFFFSRNAQSEN
ncbi:hypothetical protein PIB30_010154 [Stylosanthes scabra]|uniref:Aminotransferase-like plant mobile domain-containing protein n=1 Tax=Stylosanthes scabra TaxID=79078 RepID=A0ABU6Q655_9FABA|nr:hypothetical protein [Stylosanthes scabra]